eukprot:GHVS01080811.1.p1 GENE.GHVS01080811.1~~GHVS01080811.1.p1  ORF type:complete len:510 (-),score=90.91 GHVS01080811.1:232-1761(-)
MDEAGEVKNKEGVINRKNKVGSGSPSNATGKDDGGEGEGHANGLWSVLNYPFSSSSSLWRNSPIPLSGLLVLLSSLGLRIILFAANLSPPLVTTVPTALSSPIFSNESIQEALALLRSNLSAYSGGVCHLPPLLLSAWHHVVGRSPSSHFALLLWQEVVVALFLFDTARWWSRGNRWKDSSGDVFVAGCYFLNPFTIASDLTLSIHSIRLLLLSAVIYFTCRSSPNILPPPQQQQRCSSSSTPSSGPMSSSSSSSSSFWKSLSILFYSLLLYLSPLDFIGLGLPLSLIFVAERRPLQISSGQAEKNVLGDGGEKEVVVGGWRWLRACLALYGAVAVAVAFLHMASYCVNNYDWGYLDSCLVAMVQHRDLSPNLGAHWYLFQMLFERYETLFCWILQAHHLMYVLPLCLVLKNKPLALLHTLVAPYATVSDACFIACLILTHHDIVEKMIFMKALIVSFVSIVLYFIMECLWLARNTANSNFLYSMQVTFTISTGILIIDFVRTNIRDLD